MSNDIIIRGKMEILEQIDNIMNKKIVSSQGYKIDYLSVIQSVQSYNLNYFINLFDKDGKSLREQFGSKEELARFLNFRGFKIYTKNKS